jgi:hypothetical protein
MTLIEQWELDPTKRPALATLLADPVLQEAIHIVKEMGFVPMAAPSQGADYLAAYAVRGAKREGYLEAISNLIELSKIKRPAPAPRKPWERTEKELEDERKKLETGETYA